LLLLLFLSLGICGVVGVVVCSVRARVFYNQMPFPFYRFFSFFFFFFFFFIQATVRTHFAQLVLSAFHVNFRLRQIPFPHTYHPSGLSFRLLWRFGQPAAKYAKKRLVFVAYCWLRCSCSKYIITPRGVVDGGSLQALHIWKASGRLKTTTKKDEEIHSI